MITNKKEMLVKKFEILQKYWEFETQIGFETTVWKLKTLVLHEFIFFHVIYTLFCRIIIIFHYYAKSVICICNALRIFFFLDVYICIEVFVIFCFIFLFIRPAFHMHDLILLVGEDFLSLWPLQQNHSLLAPLGGCGVTMKE